MSWLRKFASNASTGGGRVDVPVLLAPMAGVNDLAFRQLCVECGVDLTYTEMVSSKALSFANEKTRHLLDRAPNEKRVAVQLFGHEPQTMAREAAWVEEQMGDALAYIDINMGCPARKIVKKGDGSALLTTPDTACDIVRQVSAAVEHPVTVKFRKGYHEGEDVAVEFARRVEDAGAAAVAHGRPVLQRHRRLGCRSSREAGRRHSRHRQRRRAQRLGCRSARRAHRMRCGDDRTSRPGRSVAFRAREGLLAGRGRACFADGRRACRHGPPACRDPFASHGEQSRVHAQARHVVSAWHSRRRPRARRTESLRDPVRFRPGSRGFACGPLAHRSGRGCVSGPRARTMLRSSMMPRRSRRDGAVCDIVPTFLI